MSYRFETNTSNCEQMKIIMRYLGYHRHHEEIGSGKSEIKFEGDVVTSLETVKTVRFTSELERVDYSLGYENEEISFTIKDKYRYYAKAHINHESPLSDRTENATLFTRVIFTYSEPEAKHFLIEESMKWFEEYYCSSRDENSIQIYINTERDYFKKISERPKRELDTIYLPKSEKQRVVDMIRTFLKPETRDLYTRLGKTYKLVIALHGLPGTGKTSFIHSLASIFDYSISIYFNNRKTEDTDIPTLLQMIRGNSFLVFEDADSLFSSREDSGSKSMTFSTILNILDGFASPVNSRNPLIIFVTTNCLEKMDKTMIRPGRIDHFMEFKEMRDKEIKAMMKKFSSDSYTDDYGEQFCKGLKSSRYKVTPAVLEQHFFKWLGQPEKMISEIGEIGVLKEIVDSKRGDLYT